MDHSFFSMDRSPPSRFGGEDGFLYWTDTRNDLPKHARACMQREIWKDEVLKKTSFASASSLLLPSSSTTRTRPTTATLTFYTHVFVATVLDIPSPFWCISRSPSWSKKGTRGTTGETIRNSIGPVKMDISSLVPSHSSESGPHNYGPMRKRRDFWVLELLFKGIK